MRVYAVVIFAGAFLAVPAVVSSQGVEIGPRGVEIHPSQGRSVAPDCAELRRACLSKDELGDQGEGNCRRYREVCEERD